MDQSMIADVDIQQISTVKQIQSCYEVMLQLRPHLIDEQAFIEQVQRQIAEGYQLACCQDDGKVMAVAGFRFLEFLAWGKVLYIDDLITDSKARKNGHGGKTLEMGNRTSKTNELRSSSSRQWTTTTRCSQAILKSWI